ncbi:MAG: lysylphosphatidylglycerol synthase domain-containing protein [Metallosphaera yellowstonensis]|jgi:Uncharacterised protein family (UPF0104).
MERKYLAAVLIPPAVIVSYSLYFHIDLLSVITSVDPLLLAVFLGSYFAQLILLSVRDSRIAKVTMAKAFKARLLGNAVGLIIPGWAGQDLTRAAVYSKGGEHIVDSFASSLMEAFYDVTVGSAMFLLLVFLRATPVDLIYILITLGNLVGWSLGAGYVVITSGRVVKAEEKFVKMLKLQEYYHLLQRGKARVRDVTGKKEFLFNSLLTALGYVVQSVAFYYVVPSLPLDVLVNMTYFAATLIPVPASSGFAELGLSIYFTPKLVLELRILELLNYSLGFLFIKEVNLRELKKQFDEIRVNGKLPERPGT